MQTQEPLAVQEQLEEKVFGTIPKKYFESIPKDNEPLEIITHILAALEKLVPHRIEPIAWLDATMLEIFRNNGSVSMADLLAQTSFSARHFRRKFKEIVGISPKYFCKVIQLNSVFKIIKSDNTEKLHALALDYGYYDQAHFINDFNRLIGENPSDFLGGDFVHLKSYLGRNGV